MCIAVSILIVRGVIEKRSSTAINNTGTTICLRLVLDRCIFTTVKPFPRLVNILVGHGVVWGCVLGISRNSGAVEGDANKRMMLIELYI